MADQPMGRLQTVRFAFAAPTLALTLGLACGRLGYETVASETNASPEPDAAKTATADASPTARPDASLESDVAQPATVDASPAARPDASADTSGADATTGRDATGGGDAMTRDATAGDSQTPRPASALIGHWRFDERDGLVARDSSGNDLHGTLRNFGASPWTTGRLGGALALDGMRTYVEIAPPMADPLAGSNALTAAAWVRLDRVYAPPAANTPHVWQMVLSRADAVQVGEQFGLGILNDRLAGLVDTYRVQSPCLAPDPIATGAWVHVGLTYDGHTVRVYSQGRLVCESMTARSLAPDTGPLIIGGNWNQMASAPSEIFGGLVDEVLLYSRALSASEMATLAAGAPPP